MKIHCTYNVPLTNALDFDPKSYISYDNKNEVIDDIVSKLIENFSYIENHKDIHMNLEQIKSEDLEEFLKEWSILKGVKTNTRVVEVEVAYPKRGTELCKINDFYFYKKDVDFYIPDEIKVPTDTASFYNMVEGINNFYRKLIDFVTDYIRTAPQLREYDLNRPILVSVKVDSPEENYVTSCINFDGRKLLNQ